MLKIKKARQKAGLNQKEFSDALRKHDRRLDVPTMSKYENGHHYPTPKQALAICKVTGVTLGELASSEDVDFCARVVRSAANKKAPPKRTKAGRVMFRILESEKSQFDKALEICGYATIQSWGDTVKAELMDRAADKQREREFPPEGAALEPVEAGGVYDPFEEVVEHDHNQ